MMKTDNPAEKTVTRFLKALEQQDHITINELLHPNLVYTNVSLPSFKGGKRVAQLIKFGLNNSVSLQVENHHIASKDDVVLTERTDILKIGPLHISFWVCGTFKVENGQIILWKDYFDWLAISKGFIRGVVGIGIPNQYLKP